MPNATVLLLGPDGRDAPVAFEVFVGTVPTVVSNGEVEDDTIELFCDPVPNELKSSCADVGPKTEPVCVNGDFAANEKDGVDVEIDPKSPNTFTFR